MVSSLEKISVELDEEQHGKLEQILENYNLKSYEEFFDIAIKYWDREKRPSAVISANTVMMNIGRWVDHFGANMHLMRPHPEIANDLCDLRPEPKDDGTAVGEVIIIGAGPSIFEEDYRDLRLLAKYGTPENAIVLACDRILKPCLANGVIPDYVVSIDAQEVIADWYADELIREYKAQVPLIANAYLHPRVAREWLDDGGEVYWFIGGIDPQIIQNIGHAMNQMAKKTQIHTGGNVGFACWFISILLKRCPAILIGFDFSYPLDEPIWKTQKFRDHVLIHKGRISYNKDNEVTLVELPTEDCLSNIHKNYRKLYNPYWQKWCLTDISFNSMKDAFILYLQSLMEAGAMLRTVNCTPGGALFDTETNLIQIQDWEGYLRNGAPPKPDWMPSFE